LPAQAFAASVWWWMYDNAGVSLSEGKEILDQI
jgi:hypothetical protein